MCAGLIRAVQSGKAAHLHFRNMVCEIKTERAHARAPRNPIDSTKARNQSSTKARCKRQGVPVKLTATAPPGLRVKLSPARWQDPPAFLPPAKHPRFPPLSIPLSAPLSLPLASRRSTRPPQIHSPPPLPFPPQGGPCRLGASPTPSSSLTVESAPGAPPASSLLSFWNRLKQQRPRARAINRIEMAMGTCRGGGEWMRGGFVSGERMRGREWREGAGEESDGRGGKRGGLAGLEGRAWLGGGVKRR